VSAVPLLCLVLLATFALASLLLAGVVAIAWRAGLGRRLDSAADLLALRLLPAAGGLLIVLAVVLPAFLGCEPHRQREAAGPVLLALAAFALVAMASGAWRASRACADTRALLHSWGASRSCKFAGGQRVQLIDAREPIVAVVGTWRPRVVAAECVVAACDPEEFQQVIAHEAAHISSRDNLKQLLLLACPDALAWTALGATLTRRWRAAAEVEADQRAAGHDSRKRVVLATALIKVARALGAAGRSNPVLALPMASADVAGRVQRLLAPPDPLPAARVVGKLGWFALLTLVAAVPLYSLVHELIEVLVRLGLP
jgi:hypothetical protein